MSEQLADLFGVTKEDVDAVLRAMGYKLVKTKLFKGRRHVLKKPVRVKPATSSLPVYDSEATETE